ncbi:MAG: transporter [Ignavibacteriaceae bacterium]|nr:transporter [Ignavibacteriaceae bacterium]
MKLQILNISLSFMLLTYAIEVTAQVAGVSSNKLTLLSATILPVGTFEFEPAFVVLNSRNAFNENWKSIKQPGQNTSSSLDFRMTAGLTENFEMGASISSNTEEILVGAKYLVFQSDELGFGLSGGTSLPAGNRFLADSAITHEFIYKLSFGSIVTYNFSDDNSIDIAVIYTAPVGENDLSDQIYAGLGWGYLIQRNFQFIVEVAGYVCLDQEICSSKLSLFPGITYDVTDNFSFALGFQHDLIGKNEENAFGYFAAFTISIN